VCTARGWHLFVAGLTWCVLVYVTKVTKPDGAGWWQGLCMHESTCERKDELFDSDGLDREKQMLRENCWHLIWNSKRD
jgi:hypothetical protein